MKLAKVALCNLIAPGLLLLEPGPISAAQKTRSFTAGFEITCAETITLPVPIHDFLEERIRREGRLGVEHGPDRAVRWDLNGDGAPEYFVPFDCGTSGNCIWGLFDGKELRHLGDLEAFRAYVSTAGNGKWPPIEVCLGAGTDTIWVATYNLHRARYDRGTWQPMAGTLTSGALHRYYASRPELKCPPGAPSP
jgi:hypothetical protein